MKLKLRFSCPQKLYPFLLGALILSSFTQIFAQKHSTKHKKVTVVKKASAASQLAVTTSAVDNSPNRLDACIQRNRKLAADIVALNEMLVRQSNQIINSEGASNYFKMTLQNARDSVKTVQRIYTNYVSKANSVIKSLRDSLETLQEFQHQVSRDKQRVVRDTNVVRVYNMPYDQVRVKVLRKVLDEGVGVVIERNTDEGFLVSKVFKDRKTAGLVHKTIDTRVDCDIRMVQHPFEDNKTLFYATTRVQVKGKGNNNAYVEITDPEVIRDYQKKLLSFFDEFLVSK